MIICVLYNNANDGSCCGTRIHFSLRGLFLSHELSLELFSVWGKTVVGF